MLRDPHGGAVDLGFVGEVTRVDRATIEESLLCGNGAGDSLDVRR